MVVKENKGKISIFCGKTLRREEKLLLLREIKGITLSPIQYLQEIDDSFLQIVGTSSIEIV